MDGGVKEVREDMFFDWVNDGDVAGIVFLPCFEINITISL